MRFGGDWGVEMEQTDKKKMVWVEDHITRFVGQRSNFSFQDFSPDVERGMGVGNKQENAVTHINVQPINMFN